MNVTTATTTVAQGRGLVINITITITPVAAATSEPALTPVTPLGASISSAADLSGADVPSPPPLKKARLSLPPHQHRLNINEAVTKPYERKSLRELCEAPVSALQGLGVHSEAILKTLKVKSIHDLGCWQYYRLARAMVGLAAKEEPHKRQDGAMLNINHGMNKEHEKKSLRLMIALPPSALQGLAAWVDGALAQLGVRSIEDLGRWKYAHWAEAIVELAELEGTTSENL
eukprot:NODE_13751_length_1148_cov_12.790402.p1 GENE.NODE_13751_length_1148_cov_12.790402~~NODE_13751_length_1148_cov_12.790402.p1  ORF type:complete len:230 (+),score=56.67 NODE_13751_length_1148_cov_12.790402:79-768(+)